MIHFDFRPTEIGEGRTGVVANGTSQIALTKREQCKYTSVLWTYHANVSKQHGLRHLTKSNGN